MAYLHATYVLTKKNVLISLRDIFPLLITLFSTFLSLLLLDLVQISIDNGDTFAPETLNTPNPSPLSLTFIPRCVPFEVDTCLTLAYVPDDNARVKEWVEKVASENNIPSRELRAFSSGQLLNRHLVSNPNFTQAAYIFDQQSLDAIDQQDIRFIVQYNETRQFEFPLDTTDFHSQVVVPSMIHHMNLVLMSELSSKSIDIDISTSVFPHPNLVRTDGSGEGQDAFGLYGPLLTFATYFLSVVIFLYKIVLEKERGLRDAMRLAGQYQSQHFISWCLPYLFFNIILTFLFMAFGKAFSFKYFTDIQFSVSFLTLLTFAVSLVGWTMLFAAFIQKAESVSSISFIIYIFGYIISSPASIVYRLDEDGEPVVGDNVLFFRQLFAIFPSTMLLKALEDANNLALTGIGLNFESAGTYTTVFPVKDCWIWMLASGFIAFLLSIYLDNVISSEHGVPLSPHYFLSPAYWGIKRKKSASLERSNSSYDSDDQSFGEGGKRGMYDPNVEDVDVGLEREAVAKGDRDSAGLVIKNVSRTFGQTTALDDVSFSVKKNTAFALLGHNGAGKSTLFNILVTSLRPTAGDAFIYGLSVRHNKNEVRKLLGVCPQFDIFWDKLTGAEHIEVFSALKGMKGQELQNEIVERLHDVSLTSKANAYAESYSGGMQRRLSVALSLTGDPKIVLLDECTSGADPLVRRDLWHAIERAKKGRVIFMITHSIAEAQHLAGHNSIGILAKGKLRVLGNAMHLKTKFGAGYRILVVLRHSRVLRRLEHSLVAVCPGTRLLSSAFGDNGEMQANFEMPRDATEFQVLKVVEIVGDRKEEFQIVDFSLNSTSLAEVFKSITSLSEDVREDENVEGEGKGRCSSCC